MKLKVSPLRPIRISITALAVVLSVLLQCSRKPSEPVPGPQEIYIAPVDTNDIVSDSLTGALMVNKWLIVHFKEDVDTATVNSIISERNSRKIGVIPQIRMYQLEILDTSTVTDKVHEFSVDPHVHVAIPYIVIPVRSDTIGEGRPLDSTGKSSSIEQSAYVPSESEDFHGYDYNFWPYDKMQAWQAWEVTRGDARIDIAILDSGVRETHEDLSGKITFFNLNESISPGDDLNHGTAVAGIAAAAFNNRKGIPGIAGKAKIASYKVTVGGYLNVLTEAGAITGAATRGAKVINMSWGAPARDPNEWSESLAAIVYAILYPAITHAWNSGCVLVAAVGPDSGEPWNIGEHPVYPASDERVIAVTGTEYSSILDRLIEDLADLNWGTDLVAAPQRAYAPSSSSDNDYRYFPGSSCAAPFVSGIAALVWSVNPELTNIRVKEIIEESCDQLETSRPIGHGRVNAYKAVIAATGDSPPTPVQLNDLSEISSSSISLSWSENNDADFFCYRIFCSEDEPVTPRSRVVGQANVRSATTFTHTGLDPSTTYYYKVFVFDTLYLSSGSNEVSATTSLSTDVSPPAAITDLSPGEPTQTSIKLTWTAPGDDGISGTASQYDIRYSTSYINESNWGSATEAAGEPVPLPAGTSQSFVVTGLTPNTTYYFAMKTADEVPNWSGLSNVENEETLPAADVDPPAAVVNLAASATQSSITLTWSAPGDDGSTGIAAQYDIRYSTTPIIESNWSSATQVSEEPTPQPAGFLETFTISGLNPSTTYYFALKTADEVPNWSDFSNIASATTSPAPDLTPPAAISDLAASEPTQNSVTLSWTAPGDDGNSGTASQYDIRFSTTHITESNWTSATQVSGEPSPNPAGGSETFVVTSLSPSTTYYFAIKTADEVPSWSDLSNVESATTQSDGDFVVYFPDPNLEGVIREKINKPTGDIHASELLVIDTLEARARGISALIGMENCHNLVWLRLEGNQITDISPLSGLTSLQVLDLSLNIQITDISPLSSLTSLQYLALFWNQITDISPLSGLTSLQLLHLGENQITDISPLSGLTGLESLWLNHNQIMDISPLSGLAGLQALYLYYNQITDISPLSSLTGLTGLAISNNQIADISPLSSLTSLHMLGLEWNQITDILPLVSNPGLGAGDRVYLSWNPLSETSIDEYIPILRSRGVLVYWDGGGSSSLTDQPQYFER